MEIENLYPVSTTMDAAMCKHFISLCEVVLYVNEI